MRISVTRTGGLTGRTLTATADLTGRLATLAEEVLSAGDHPGTVPDGYRYVLTDGTRTIRCADPRLTPGQRELIRAVLNAP